MKAIYIILCLFLSTPMPSSEINRPKGKLIRSHESSNFDELEKQTDILSIPKTPPQPSRILSPQKRTRRIHTGKKRRSIVISMEDVPNPTPTPDQIRELQEIIMLNPSDSYSRYYDIIVAINEQKLKSSR